MKIRIVSFRRTTPREIEALETDYINRLKKTVPIELIDLKPKSGARSNAQTGLKEDSARLLQMLGDKETVVILDRLGKAFDSEELAAWFKGLLHGGTKRLTFVVGSAEGLGEEVKKRAEVKIKLSNLTLPHQLARLVLLEAIYRSFDILGNGNYHK